jgi:hypothetical protein
MDGNSINKAITDLDFAYSKTCGTCPGRIRVYRDRKSRLTIKHFQTIKRVMVLDHNIQKAFEKYEHFQKIIDTVEQFRSDATTPRSN